MYLSIVVKKKKVAASGKTQVTYKYLKIKT